MALGKNLAKSKVLESNISKESVRKKNIAKPTTAEKKEVKKTTIKKTITRPAKAAGKTIKEPINKMQISAGSKSLRISNEERKKIRTQFEAEIEALKNKEVHLIIFNLGDTFYGIDIHFSKEVVLTPPIVKMPGLPNYAPGVVNVRGELITIIDLFEKFKLQKSENSTSYTLILKNISVKIGLLLPEVPVTLKSSGNQIESIGNFLADLTIDETFIKGILKDKDRMVFYLDALSLANAERLQIEHSSND